MRKKILISLLMLSLLVCLCAVSVSAADFVSDFGDTVTKFYEADGTTEKLPEWIDLDDKEATAVIKKADGTLIRIPLYYIYQEKGTEFRHEIRDTSGTGSSGFKYAWISQVLGEAIDHTKLIALEIPEGTKTTSGLSSYTAIEEVVFPLTATTFPKCENNKTLRRVFARQAIAEDGTVMGITTIPAYYFKNVPTLESFKLELDYVTSIGANAFLNSALKEVRFEGPITLIGTGAFGSSKQLSTVYINNTSDKIISCGQQSFMGCHALASVTFNGLSFETYAFEKIDGGVALTVVATNVGYIGQSAFGANKNLVSVDISGPIASVGGNVFSNCTNLKSVKIVNTLDTPATCGNSICEGLKNLSSINMHGISIGGYSFKNINGTDMKATFTNVGTVGEGAFIYAGNITELYIEGPITSIGNSTYRECPKLKKLTVISTSDTYITAGNGESNPVLEELYLKGKIDIKGSPVFQNNKALKHVYLGEGVREIGESAFYKCYALETMYLADTITVIKDKAIDMDAAGKQTSASFMFVDENGNMDNYMPRSLTTIGGHFLKHFTIANTQIIFPEGFTYHNSSSAYDFEGTKYPEGFAIVYLGKMTCVNLHILYQHNASRDVTVYLTKNSASDVKNYRVEANVSDTGAISHGAYAGVNPDGTLEIVVDDRIHNNIKATEYIKLVFCGSDEVCFITRVNIPWASTTSSWGNFVSTPVTYDQLAAAYALAEKTAPAKHPVAGSAEYSDATCTEPGGVKTYCLACGQIAAIEKTSEALGHNYDYLNNSLSKLLSISYTSYGAKGVKTISCANGCGIDGAEEADELFICLGYSASLRDSGFLIGFKVNGEAISEYETVEGVSLAYGVFAISKGCLGDGDVFDANGNAASGAVTKDLSAYPFSVFTMKVTGFTTEEQKAAEIAIGAFVAVSDGEATEYSYVQQSEAVNGEKYSFVSCNDVIE